MLNFRVVEIGVPVLHICKTSLSCTFANGKSSADVPLDDLTRVLHSVETNFESRCG